MQVHFLQSSAWETFQSALGRQTFRRTGTDWEFLAVSEASAGFKRLYCPYGPVVSSEQALGQALAALQELARQEHATFVRLQPTGTNISRENLRKHGLKQVAFSQPSHTWMLDLTQSEETILSHMKQNTRNICRNYRKKGLVYEQSSDPKDIAYLTSLLQQTANMNRITVHSDAYFTKQAEALVPIGAASLHLMKYQSEVIACALVYEDQTTSYYAHAASSFEHRKLNAATALLGEIIFDAKRKGKTLFDFYGIAPTDDSSHKWAGFTSFKKSFGGYERHYSDTYELPVRKASYSLYSLLRKLR